MAILVEFNSLHLTTTYLGSFSSGVINQHASDCACHQQTEMLCGIDFGFNRLPGKKPYPNFVDDGGRLQCVIHSFICELLSGHFPDLLHDKVKKLVSCVWLS